MRWTPNQSRASLRALGPAGIGDLRPIRGLCPARVGADDALPVWEPIDGGRVLAAVAGVGPAASQSDDRGSATRRAAVVLEALSQQAAELAELEVSRGLFPLSLTGALGDDPDPREIPTDWSEVTLAGALLDTQLDRLRLWWVGDARIYYLDSVSLYRLSYDDMPGPGTRVASSGPVFWTRTVDIRPASPGIVFVCTAGAHAPFAAPWLLEQALIGAFQRADGWKSWISLVNKAITHQASAGASFSAVPWGAGSYEGVRDTILGPGGNRLCDLAVMQSAMGGSAWLKAWLTLYGPVQERWRWSLTAPIGTDDSADAYASERRSDELRTALQVVAEVSPPPSAMQGATGSDARPGVDAEFDDGPFRPTAWAGVADALHRLAEEWGRAAEPTPAAEGAPEPSADAAEPEVRPIAERAAGAAADLSALAALAALSNRGTRRSEDQFPLKSAPAVEIAIPFESAEAEKPEWPLANESEVTVELEIPVIATLDEAPVLGSIVEVGAPPDLPHDPEPVPSPPPASPPPASPPPVSVAAVEEVYPEAEEVDGVPLDAALLSEAGPFVDAALVGGVEAVWVEAASVEVFRPEPERHATTVGALVAEITKEVPVMPDEEDEPPSQAISSRRGTTDPGQPPHRALPTRGMSRVPTEAGPGREPQVAPRRPAAGQPLRSPSPPRGFLGAFLLVVLLSLLVVLIVRPWDRQALTVDGWPPLSAEASVHSQAAVTGITPPPRVLRSDESEDQIPRSTLERLGLDASDRNDVLAIRGPSSQSRRVRADLALTVQVSRIVRPQETDGDPRGMRRTPAMFTGTYASARAAEPAVPGPARRRALTVQSGSYASERASVGFVRRSQLGLETDARSIRSVVLLADMRMRSKVYMVLRKGPSMATRKVWVIPPGGEVAVIGRKAGTHWVRLRFGHREGWSAAVKRFLVPVQEFTLDDIPTIAL